MQAFLCHLLQQAAVEMIASLFAWRGKYLEFVLVRGIIVLGLGTC